MSQFASGQVWRYETRTGEEQSRITILKVELHPKLGRIVHIHVTNLAISQVISHLPFAAESLAKSVTELERTDVKLPAYQDGYNHWKRAVDDGKAGVWTTSVAEAVAAMEKALNQ